MEPSSKVNGLKMVFDMEGESSFGPMDQSMRVGGRTTWQMAKEDSFTLMVTST